MTGPYNVEVVIRHNAAMPFRVSAVATEERVKEIVQSFLAAWGRPEPATLQDTGVSRFVDRLAEAGKYRSDTAEHLIVVRLTNGPDPVAALMFELSQRD